ncbi:hypothetical protein CIPAW_06G149400 [Carya illinoinensis]|uniref:Pinin/SDK/MemA protein domain-containing protein n=1 Tax=Carya illinoinensis TaxID=32201 RepID=A0A8T1QC95_CARIL|nr:hypothetical protein CIPAW_06G149400 [Carya illinoinensis]
MGSIDATAAEKSEQELRKEIDELLRQQRQITERLRDPRELRRGVFSDAGPRNFASNGALQRSLIRPVSDRTDAEDQPPGKRRLSSAVVKKENAVREEVAGAGTANQSDRKPSNLKQTGWSRRDENQRAAKTESEGPVVKHVPRVLPKNEDPSLVTRNKRMLGRLLGTLEKFRKEDMQLSGTEAYMRRSNSLQMAEQRACEESERLRQQEREQIAEKRRRDLTLRARVTAKTEEKKLELLFLQTKAEPPIYYSPNKPLEEDETLVQQQKGQAFLEWKATRREELSLYQKQIQEQYVANVEKDLETWQNARKARKTNNDMLNLQETMDKELDTHWLEHGPKKRKIPNGNKNEDEDDVEDINVAEDDMMDDVLDVDVPGRSDETVKPEAVGDGFLLRMHILT